MFSMIVLGIIFAVLVGFFLGIAYDIKFTSTERRILNFLYDETLSSLKKHHKDSDIYCIYTLAERALHRDFYDSVNNIIENEI